MATVLVIKYNPTTRQLIRAIIEGLGHEVWEASNGEDGIKLCRLLLPDLVVTDIVMPVQDGIETMVELKAIFSGAKFIAMSTHPDKLELALRLGARDVFQKPFSLHEFGEAVQEAVQTITAQPRSYSMRPVYVRVELYDEENPSERTYTLSPVPFRQRFGEDIRPTKKEKTIVTTYADLRKTLLKKFGIPRNLIPFRKYFDPTPEEIEEEASTLYRTLPEGLGEPECMVRAKQAIRDILDDATLTSEERGGIEIEGTMCSSMDDLRRELETIAENAGGKRKTPAEPYGPQYDDLVDSVLLEYYRELSWLDLKDKRTQP